MRTKAWRAALLALIASCLLLLIVLWPLVSILLALVLGLAGWTTYLRSTHRHPNRERPLFCTPRTGTGVVELTGEVGSATVM